MEKEKGKQEQTELEELREQEEMNEQEDQKELEEQQEEHKLLYLEEASFVDPLELVWFGAAGQAKTIKRLTKNQETGWKTTSSSKRIIQKKRSQWFYNQIALSSHHN